VNSDETNRRLEALERKMDGVERLLRIGMPVVTGLDSKVNALIDSHMRLYDSIQRLSEAQIATERSLGQLQAATQASLRELSESQAATERSLKTLIDSLTHRNGKPGV
jgi:hypothetical protein